VEGAGGSFLEKRLLSGQHPKGLAGNLRKIGIVTQMKRSCGECWRTFSIEIDIEVCPERNTTFESSPFTPSYYAIPR